VGSDQLSVPDVLANLSAALLVGEHVIGIAAGVDDPQDLDFPDFAL
jgi:hypothetical protein